MQAPIYNPSMFEVFRADLLVVSALLIAAGGFAYLTWEAVRTRRVVLRAGMPERKERVVAGILGCLAVAALGAGVYLGSGAAVVYGGGERTMEFVPGRHHRQEVSGRSGRGWNYLVGTRGADPVEFRLPKEVWDRVTVGRCYRFRFYGEPVPGSRIEHVSEVRLLPLSRCPRPEPDPRYRIPHIEDFM